MHYGLLRRFFAKLVHDVLPAALASLIGGVVLAHYGLGRPPEPAGMRAAPASPEMMGVLRDEHALVVNYLKAQIAKEKATAEPVAAKDVAAAPVGDAGAVKETSAVTPARVAAIKPAAPHRKASQVGASLPPLVIADEQRIDEVKPVVRTDDSLFARTIGLKDHVIAATQHAVAVIGGIPSWFGAIGDRIGGGSANPRPPAYLVSTS